MLQELIEKLSKGELPQNEYSCMNDPSASFHGTSHAPPLPTSHNHAPPAHSMRSRRTATWAKPRNSDDGYSRYMLAVSLPQFKPAVCTVRFFADILDWTD